MQAELEPPKPTKEFHEAYLEIYGKKKKDEAAKALPELGLALEIPSGKKETEMDKENKKQLDLDLAALDIPPIKGKDIQIMEMPETKSEEPNEKKGLISRFFGKAKQKEAEATIPTQEPLDLGKLEIPTIKMPIPSAKESKRLESMDMPPPKLQIPETAKKTMPGLDKWDIESPRKAVQEIAKKPSVLSMFTKPAQKKEPQSKMPSSHDFLAEIKFGSRKKEEAPIMPPLTKPEIKREEKPIITMPSFSVPEKEKYPLFDERAETAFEKTTMKTGARD